MAYVRQVDRLSITLPIPDPDIDVGFDRYRDSIRRSFGAYVTVRSKDLSFTVF